MKRLIFFICLSFPSWGELIKAKAYFLKWDFKNAQIIYEEELKKTNNPLILFNLAICYQKQGRLLYFKNLKTDYPNLRDGLFFFYKGNYKKAFNSFSRDKTRCAYIGMGMCKKAEGDFKKAEKLFLKAKGILGYVNLSNLYLVLGKEKKYLKTIEEGIKNTKDTELFFSFAKFLNDKKRFYEAFNILKELQEKEEENILIKEELLKTLMFLGKEEEEIFSIIKASYEERMYLEGCFCAFSRLYFRAFRQFSSSTIPLASLKALWITKELSLKKKADELYKEISLLIPEEATADVYLAELWTKLGSLSAAFNYAKNALKKEPNLEIAHFALGNIYYLKNDFKNAIISYKNGINQSFSQKHFYLFLNEAFTLRFLPIFLSGYALLWIITIFLLLLIHLTGMSLIKDYPSLKRYAVKKRYLLYFYPFVTTIFIASLILGERTIKYVPIELLQKTLTTLITFLPCSIIFILILSLILGNIIKWPKLKIYLSFVLLDISLDIAIIVLVSSLVPFFADYPSVFSVISIICVVLFRRARFFVICFVLLVLHLFLSHYLLSGYKNVEKGRLKEGGRVFKNVLRAIWIIKWLEPTYSDIAASCILGKTFILLKRNEYREIEAAWNPLLKSLKDWWPLNIRAKFLYDFSICLSEIMQGEKEEAFSMLKNIASISEYKNKQGISFLFNLLSERIERKEKKEKYINFIISYLAKS